MDCADARTEISARIDGESTEERLRALDAHLATCAGCRAYAHAVATLHRRARVRAAEPVPELTAGVLAAIGNEARDARAERATGLRIGLALIGVVQMLLALPALVLGEDAGVPEHTARHLGSFALALGIGFVVAAWQPRRVAGLLALTSVLVACLLVSSVIDVVAGDARPTSEIATHATELVGVGLLWLLGRETGQTVSLRVHWPHGSSGG